MIKSGICGLQPSSHSGIPLEMTGYSVGGTRLCWGARVHIRFNYCMSMCKCQPQSSKYSATPTRHTRDHLVSTMQLCACTFLVYLITVVVVLYMYHLLNGLGTKSVKGTKCTYMYMYLTLCFYTTFGDLSRIVVGFTAIGHQENGKQEIGHQESGLTRQPAESIRLAWCLQRRLYLHSLILYHASRTYMYFMVAVIFKASQPREWTSVIYPTITLAKSFEETQKFWQLYTCSYSSGQKVPIAFVFYVRSTLQCFSEKC